jgi:hypothetical protein
MILIFDELNKEQLSGLANLCFDLAKISFASIFIPAENFTKDVYILVGSKIALTFIGLAFTRSALILLKLKENIIK